MILSAGVSAADFYGLTFKEAADFIMYCQREKANAAYANAMLVSSFVGLGLNGQRPPHISTIYPELFKAPEEDYETNELLFRQFATQHNAQRGRK